MGELQGRYSAVLFDLDGVLIDSPLPHARSWVDSFRALGVELPVQRLLLDEGRKSRDEAMDLAVEYGLRLSDAEIDALVARKREHYRKFAPKGLRNDAAAALTALKQAGWRMGLVSGSVAENLHLALNEVELSFFDVIIMSGDYALGKPHPEPYLTACKALKLPPETCVAVENAPLGIQSARDAGLFVIGLASSLEAKFIAGAHVVTDDLTSLPALLGDPICGY